MNAIEMIDRYVNAVGEHLPRKMRMDIEMELRSLLLDTLEEQSDGEPTAKIAAEVLRDFGHPEEIAARYRPEEVLIGARLFPIYRLVLTITLSIVTLVHVLGLGFLLWRGGGADFVGTVIESVVAFGRSAFLNAGIVTLIFAAAERVMGDSLELPEKLEPRWDPYELPPVKDPDRINRVELVVGILFMLILISWLNFFPNWFGGSEITGEDSWIFALLSPGLIQQIPWLTAAWLLDIALKTVVLLQGRWSRATRWLELASEGFGLYVLYRIYSLEQLFVVPFFTFMARWVLVVIFVIVILEMLGKLYRLLFGRPFTPGTLIKSKLA